ncbi:MAG: CHAT domain-containing protein [Treponema sp.]|nr:CHAT domain-containing protein [Treponema sp.]
MKKLFCLLLLFCVGFQSFSQEFEEKRDALEKNIAAAKEKYGEDSGQHELQLANMAVLLIQNQKFKEAEECLSKIDAILSRLNLGESMDAIWVNFHLGVVSYALVKFENAVFYLEKSFSLSEKTHQEKSELTQSCIAYLVSSYTALANSQVFGGKPYDAIESYKNALVYLEKSGIADYKTEAIIYEGTGMAYANTGDYNSAKDFLLKAIATGKKADENESNVAVFYNDISTIYDMLGERDESVNALETAHEIYEKLEKKNGYPDVNFASVCAFEAFKSCLKKNLIRADAYITRALDILEKTRTNDEFYKAKTYMIISRVYFIEGKISEAYKFQKKAIDIQLLTFGSESDTVAASYINIANTCAALSKNEEAIGYYEKALSIFRKIHGEKSTFEAQLLTQMSKVLENLGKIDEAENSLKVALEIFEGESKELGWHKALILWELSQIYLKKGSVQDVFEGYSLLEKAIECFENSDEHNYVIDRMTEIVVFTKSGFDAINFEFKNEENKEYVMSIMKKACELGIAQAEKARLASYPDDRTELTAQVYPLYYSAIDLALKNHDTASALFYSESFRNRGFLEQLGTRTALSLPGISSADKIQYEKLTKTISELRTEILSQTEKEKEQKQQNLIETERELQKLQDSLVKKNPKCAELLFPSPIDAKEIMEKCPSDTMILEYVIWNPEFSTLNRNIASKLKKSSAVLENSSWCIIVSSEKISAVPIKDSDAIKKETEIFRNLLVDEKASFSDVRLEASAKKLYDSLLKDAEKEFNSDVKNVIIVPDGTLHSVPFDLLGEKIGEFGSKYAVSFSPSVSVSALTKNVKSGGNEKCFAIGNPAYENGGENGSRGIQKKKLLVAGKTSATEKLKAKVEQISWQNIPGTGAEIEGIRKHVFGSGMKTLLGENANEKTVKELSKSGELASFPILHFACHGYFDESEPSLSGLVFSEAGSIVKSENEDGYLRISEAATLNIKADFVNLSACQTGLSGLRSGEGFEGLSRAFLQAGASQVGVTLWSVDDEATSAFMVSLYKKTHSGLSYKDAYKKTKDEFKKSEKWSAPYYWAAFVIYE